jgi:hypothetical protein
MKQNVHSIDRIARIILGAALLAFYVLGSSDYKIFALLGIIPLLTGLVGFCPIYTLLGINGCGCKKA